MPRYSPQPPLPSRLCTKRLFGVAVTILAINDALHIVTEYLRPIPTKNLFILSGIQPIELRRQKAVLPLARCAQDPQHLSYKRLLFPLHGQLQPLKRDIFACYIGAAK